MLQAYSACSEDMHLLLELYSPLFFTNFSICFSFLSGFIVPRRYLKELVKCLKLSILYCQSHDVGRRSPSMDFIILFWILKVTSILPTKLSFGLSVQEKFKIYFQDSFAGFVRFFLFTSNADTTFFSFESIGLSVQENKIQLYFQNSGRGGHLVFLIGLMTNTISNLSQLAFRFRRNSVDFQDGGISIGKILAFFFFFFFFLSIFSFFFSKRF